MNFSQVFCIISHSLKAGQGMTCQEFWLSMLSSFVATVLAGISLYFGIELFWSKKIAKETQELEELKELLDREIKRQDFFSNIHKEISDVQFVADLMLVELESNPPYKHIQLKTSYWNTLLESGKIPYLVESYYITHFAEIYDSANKINVLYRKLIYQTNSSPDAFNLNELTYELKYLSSIFINRNIISLVEKITVQVDKKISELVIIINKYIAKLNTRPIVVRWLESLRKKFRSKSKGEN